MIDPSVTMNANNTSSVVTPATRLLSKVPFFLSWMYAIPPEAKGTKNNILEDEVSKYVSGFVRK